MKRLSSVNNKNAKQNQKKVVELEKQKNNIIDSIKQGIPVDSVRYELTKIETTLQSYKKVIEMPKARKVFPVGAAKRYTDMIEVLSIDDFGTEAFEFLRGLVEKVVVYRNGENMEADLYLLGLVPETTRPTTLSGSNHMDAGAGFVHRLRIIRT